MEAILTLGNIAKACDGTIFGADENLVVKNVVTDSRLKENGTLFVALKGEKFDGHFFADTAVANGAVCCVVDHRIDKIPCIVVENTLTALQKIALCYRMKFNVSVVGITGSVGKTSTKDMVYSVVSMGYNTHKTQGNFNNEIGLPKTVLNLKKDHQIMILEMGMSSFGEISRLTNIARPEIAVITNIGYCHIENLGSRENIRKAKLEITEGLSEDGILILNGDDELLWELKGHLPIETIYYGIENKKSDLVAQNIRKYSETTEFELKIADKTYNACINVPGEFHIYNALVATLIGLQYDIPMPQIIKGIGEFVPSGMRQKVEDCGKYTLVRDCYNASPTTMKSGLEVLEVTLKNDKKQHRRVAILADMLELGNFSESSHRMVGEQVCDFNVDCLITIGNMARFIGIGAVDAGYDAKNVYSFENNEEAKKNILAVIKENDIILFKGSRGMKLEEIADFIAESGK